MWYPIKINLPLSAIFNFKSFPWYILFSYNLLLAVYISCKDTFGSGFSFETLCLKHVFQIKKALRIDAVYSNNSSWFNQNAQIDLLIDRDDNIIIFCEIKFYYSIFSIDEKYYINLKNKINKFKQESATRKNLHLVMLTINGLKTNEYSAELIQNTLDMNCLFEI